MGKGSVPVSGAGDDGRERGVGDDARDINVAIEIHSGEVLGDAIRGKDRQKLIGT